MRRTVRRCFSHERTNLWSTGQNDYWNKDYWNKREAVSHDFEDFDFVRVPLAGGSLAASALEEDFGAETPELRPEGLQRRRVTVRLILCAILRAHKRKNVKM
jgi:hypothetical protein